MSAAALVFGGSESFRQIIEWADKYAGVEHPVLLYGETGVGKELFARRIHEKSNRALAPFLPVNCGALPPALFESELFGFERGAFSGASNGSKGIVRSANHGTLFLDEIGDLDRALQVKLLRLLDSGEIRAVGSTRVVQADVRIIAATNVDLSTAVAEGKFRQDLLERIMVLTLRIPPLRERKEDINLIARYCVAELGADSDEEIMSLLQEEPWPGNIRQLKNILTRAAVLGGKKVSVSVLRSILREESARAPVIEHAYAGSLADIEKRAIVDRLRSCRGNRKQAAEELGIAKSTLQDKLRKWREESSQNVAAKHCADSPAFLDPVFRSQR